MGIKAYTTFLLSALILLFSGCRPILVPFDEKIPAQTLSYLGAPPVTDARVHFRTIFCALMNQRYNVHKSKINCDDFLWKLIDEPQASAVPHVLPKHDPHRIVILIVPGAFHGCVGDMGIPYKKQAERFRRIGYRIKYVKVSGLSSCSKNAQIIAETVANENLKPSQRLILLGYSKGTTDILHFLVDYPDLALDVDAVLSVSGAVNGTPLTDRYYKTKYDNWFAKHTIGNCEPGDGGVFDSLSRIVQLQWLANNPLPKHVRYFSLASFAKHEDVQLLQRYTHKLLEEIDPLNDGQILAIDQIIPGSVLLGYANADHWSVAVPMEEKYSYRSSNLRERDKILRDVLFETMILFVTENLKKVADPLSTQSATQGGPLTETEWRLMEIQSMDDAVGTIRPEDPSLYTMRLNADGTVTMRLNCNRASGTWGADPSADISNGRFWFSQLAVTRALCPPLSLDEQIVAQAKYIRGYLLKDGRLYLSLFADGGIWSWEPANEVRFLNAPDSTIESAILRASPDYTREVLEAGGNTKARYIYGKVDLNGDGQNEVFAYLLGSIFCGTGGCNLMLFSYAASGYRLVNTFPISRLPVIVSPHKSNGWHDLIRPESGGGAPPSYVRHTFDGKRYVERDRLPGDATPAGKRYLAGDFMFQDGVPLQPRD